MATFPTFSNNQQDKYPRLLSAQIYDHLNQKHPGQPRGLVNIRHNGRRTWNSISFPLVPTLTNNNNNNNNNNTTLIDVHSGEFPTWSGRFPKTQKALTYDSLEQSYNERFQSTKNDRKSQVMPSSVTVCSKEERNCQRKRAKEKEREREGEKETKKETEKEKEKEKEKGKEQEREKEKERKTIPPRDPQS